jgi:hypothetical protein
MTAAVRAGVFESAAGSSAQHPALASRSQTTSVSVTSHAPPEQLSGQQISLMAGASIPSNRRTESEQLSSLFLMAVGLH